MKKPVLLFLLFGLMAFLLLVSSCTNLSELTADSPSNAGNDATPQDAIRAVVESARQGILQEDIAILSAITTDPITVRSNQSLPGIGSNGGVYSRALMQLGLLQAFLTGQVLELEITEEQIVLLDDLHARFDARFHVISMVGSNRQENSGSIMIALVKSGNAWDISEINMNPETPLAPTPAASPTPTPINSNTPPPPSSGGVNFTLPEVNGGSVSLSQYRGRPVLLVFFRTSCGHCRNEAPLLQQAYQNYSTSDQLLVLAVGVESDPGSLMQFKTEFGWTFPVLIDSNGSVYRQFAGGGVPALLFINTAGEIVHTHLGETSPGQLDTLLNQYIL
ncbi:MAG: TlpA disulfide reductase family protein [Candidatus Atribacteria bacterium]|nr:TlpA disulfide reductase family protein [Candidatus Atribacteria bacterium]